MKRITKQELQELYGSVPGEFQENMNAFLHRLPVREEKKTVKKNISFAMVAMAILVFMAVGATAALIDWNAVVGLYGREKPEMEEMMEEVKKTAQTDDVKLSVTSVLTDGKALVFDWTLEAQEGALPLYIETKNLKVNGQWHFAAWGEGMQYLWLQPGETIRQSAEIIELEQRTQPGDRIKVELTVGIHKPKQPVTFFETAADEEKAKEMRERGTWAVAPLGEAIAYRFDDEMERTDPVTLWRHYLSDGFQKDDFVQSEMKLSFEVTVPETEEYPLYPAHREIKLSDCTAYLREAYRTPLGIYTEMEVVYNEKDAQEAVAKEVLNAFALEMRVPGTVLPGNHLHNLQDTIWIDEEGRMHRRLFSGMIGYQTSLLQEKERIILDIGRYIENLPDEEGNITYRYTPSSRIPVYFQEQ